ncbi:MAG: TlpA family protein disulfide reductase [Bacteroidetes bacterium]|nr:TlpA family protein disulfide reductase [Bacteroidota bacterium]
MTKVLKTTLLVALVGVFSATAQNDLPDVSVTDINGKKVNISDYGRNGKITVLNFWATWCSPCKKELANINDMYGEWQEKYNAELLAISIDDTRNLAKVKSYVAGQSWDYEVLIDANQDLKRALNFQTIPHTVVLDRDGKIVYKHTGYTEGDEYELEEKIKALAGK